MDYRDRACTTLVKSHCRDVDDVRLARHTPKVDPMDLPLHLDQSPHHRAEDRDMLVPV